MTSDLLLYRPLIRHCVMNASKCFVSAFAMVQ